MVNNMLISFKSFIKEHFLFESNTPGSESNTSGVMHELLVGYHLNGKKHMTHHEGKTGETPKELHDRLKSSMSTDEYKRLYNRAKSAASDIRKKITANGHEISHVHWTSKNGDIEKSTGIKSSQQEDASDIIVHTKNKKFYGVSLKASDRKDSNLPVSNPGMETTLGGKELLAKHRQHILRKFPHLKGLSSKQRREAMQTDPKMDQYIRSKNKVLLHSIAKNLHGKLSEMNSKELSNHIRSHVLQSHPTPLQEKGHYHIRHTTYKGASDKILHHSINPNEHFDAILKDHKNISLEHSGTSVHFYYNHPKTGEKIKFASHRVKFESQSDPLGVVKGSGIAHI
jgi:hypothetical protein